MLLLRALRRWLIMARALEEGTMNLGMLFLSCLLDGPNSVVQTNRFFLPLLVGIWRLLSLCQLDRIRPSDANPGLRGVCLSEFALL